MCGVVVVAVVGVSSRSPADGSTNCVDCCHPSFQLRWRWRSHPTPAPAPTSDVPLLADADLWRRHLSRAAHARSSFTSRNRQCDDVMCGGCRCTSAVVVVVVVESTLTLRRGCNERLMRVHSDCLQLAPTSAAPGSHSVPSTECWRGSPPLRPPSTRRRRSPTSQLSVRQTRQASSTTVHAMRSLYDVIRPSSAITDGGRPIVVLPPPLAVAKLSTSSSSSSSSPAIRRPRLRMTAVVCSVRQMRRRLSCAQQAHDTHWNRIACFQTS